MCNKFEDLILEYMENRVAEILNQGDVAPKVIAHVRDAAAWAAERAIARFVAEDGAHNLWRAGQNH